MNIVVLDGLSWRFINF